MVLGHLNSYQKDRNLYLCLITRLLIFYIELGVINGLMLGRVGDEAIKFGTPPYYRRG